MAASYMADPHFEQVTNVIEGRCSMCHAQKPSWPGVEAPPKNVILDNPAGIASHAKDIAMEAGFSHAMPPGNLSQITDDERALIVAWYRSTNKGRGVLEAFQ
jgi:uncharacterized membrane protein